MSNEHTEFYQDFKKNVDKKNWRGLPIVVCNGTFQILHPGHFSLFEFAKNSVAYNEAFLVVAVNSNSSIEKIKGKDRIFFEDHDRYDMIRSIKWVDAVCLFYEDTPLELFKVLKPSYVVKSREYVGREVVGSDFAKVVFAPHDDRYSTTKLIEKIAQNYESSKMKYSSLQICRNCMHYEYCHYAINDVPDCSANSHWCQCKGFVNG